MERYDRPSGGYGQRPNRQALDGPSDRGSTRKAQAYGQSRLADRPRSRGAPSSEKRAAQDEIIEEFLEGLLDGFRMAGVGHRAEAPVPLQDPGNWLDLDAVPKAGASFESKKKLQNLLSRKSPSPSRGPPDDDALSVSLRRHALRAFLEETCGTVANAFDIMAGLALKASMGGSGTCDDRLHFTFHEEDFHLSLTHLGYGLGAKEPWWSALFVAMDVDGDGVVSLQDMYDALVLALPNDKEAPQVFFTEPHQKNTWLRERSGESALQRLSSPQREKR